MPSTLTVTSLADSGAGSLRADIAAAHSGDTIDFAPSLDGKTITLTKGELLINKNLTIAGRRSRRDRQRQQPLAGLRGGRRDAGQPERSDDQRR